MRAHVFAFVVLSSAIGSTIAYAAEEVRTDSDEATADEPEPTAIPTTSDPPLDVGHAESDPTTDLPPLVPLHPIGPVRDPAPPTAVVIEEQRSPWFRAPRLIAYGGGALGLAAIGAGIASGFDARAAESMYRGASTQVDAAAAKRRSERSGVRANVWLAVGGAVTAAAASTVVLDVIGVFGTSEQEPSSPASALRTDIVPIAGGAVSVWTFTLPSSP